MRRQKLGNSAHAVTAALSFCLIANLAPLMTFPAVAPEVSLAWGLDATEVGWIGGVYFVGYAVAVPFLSSATDRFDCRWMIIGSALLGATAGLAFATLADGFWLALALRFLSGVALAGAHMPGLKLIVERVTGPGQSRSVAIYASSYAVGSAGSFLLAGLIAATFGWRTMFLVVGFVPLLGIVAIVWLSPPKPRPPLTGPVLEFGSVIRNRPFMAYVVSFAGNTWEVFGIRVWFVVCLVPIRLSPIPTTSRVLPIPRVKLGLGRAAISPAMSSAS